MKWQWAGYRRVLVGALVCVLLAGLSGSALGEGQVLEKVMVPMRDETPLAVDVYLPEGDGPFPAVLVRSTYGRPGGGIAKRFNAQGFALVSQDTRGRGDSGGEEHVFEDDGWGARQDGADTVAWVLAQPWCNGKLATYGGSALGITQVLAAPVAPGITCQAINVASSNFYQDMAYRGGVWHKQRCESWLTHQKIAHLIGLWKGHTAYDYFWEGFNAEKQAGRVHAPAVHLGGWWDMFAQGTINNFTTRQYEGGEGARGNQILVMGPWTHGGPRKELELGDLTLPENQTFDTAGLEDRLFRHWLLGEDNGVMDEPPVHYYTLGEVGNPDAPGNEWRTAEDWPPLPTKETTFYLAADGGLLAKKPKSGRRDYTYDPADPCPTRGGAAFAMPAGPFDQREVSGRPDVLKFETAPLSAPMEITGHVWLRLFVSSDGPDTDFAAKMVDVYPDGREIIILDGIRRAKFRNGFEAPQLLEPGEVAEVMVDLWSVSLILNEGHKLAVHVSSSNYPRFDKNPNTGADYAEEGATRVAHNSVYCGRPHPSAILLPVVR